MESFRHILTWIYPLIGITIFIIGLIKLKIKGGLYFNIAFGIIALNSILWRIIPFVMDTMDISSSEFYKYFEIVSLLFYLTSSTMLIIGIINISNYKWEGISGQNYHSKYAGEDFGTVGLYIGLLVTGMVLTIFGFLLLFSGDYTSRDYGFIVVVLGVLLLLSAQIYFIVMLYRVWRYAISESNSLGLTPSIETPGQAIGFLFIPFFNFYWVFKAYGDISKDLNAIAKAKNYSDRLFPDLGRGIAILCILGIIPYVNFITSVIVLILFPLFINQKIKFCANLVEQK